MSISTQEIYLTVFNDYPDVLDVAQVSQLLGVSKKTVYRLLHNNAMESLKIGREYRVPKVNVMKYVKIYHPLLAESTTA